MSYISNYIKHCNKTTAATIGVQVKKSGDFLNSYADDADQNSMEVTMTEKDALKKFSECTANDDLSGACEALKFVSVETINFQDDDDYDMLIQATVDGNPCAIEALLTDGRCDLTHVENLCGMSACDFSADYAPDSRIRQLFQQKMEESSAYTAK